MKDDKYLEKLLKLYNISYNPSEPGIWIKNGEKKEKLNFFENNFDKLLDKMFLFDEIIESLDFYENLHKEKENLFKEFEECEIDYSRLYTKCTFITYDSDVVLGNEAA